jgi:hypothetical protein
MEPAALSNLALAAHAVDCNISDEISMEYATALAYKCWCESESSWTLATTLHNSLLVFSMQESPELTALRGKPGPNVLSACALLRSEWPFAHLAPVMPPIALLHQIYFLLPERTRVDREIAALQSQGVVRMFKLFAGAEGHDMCIVRNSDYELSIRALMPPEDEARSSREGSPMPNSAAAAAAASATTRMTRPASMPTGSSAAAAAAAIAAASVPIKAVSSASGLAAASSQLDQLLSAPAPAPSRSTSPAQSLPPKPPMDPQRNGASAAAIPEHAPEPKLLRRKRSHPVTAPSAVGLDTVATARSASVGAAARVKKARIENENLTLASPAAPTPPPPAFDPTGLSSAVGGVGRSLRVSLSDTLGDERFPRLMQNDAASYVAPTDARLLLQLFLTDVLPACSEVSVTHERLLELLYTPHQTRFISLRSGEASVSYLLKAGLLLSRSADSYYFRPPLIGRLLECIRNGRKEIVALIRKRVYKEMPLRELLTVKLKMSSARVEFHLREMMGSEEMITVTETTMGPLIKLAPGNKWDTFFFAGIECRSFACPDLQWRTFWPGRACKSCSHSARDALMLRAIRSRRVATMKS